MNTVTSPDASPVSALALLVAAVSSAGAEVQTSTSADGLEPRYDLRLERGLVTVGIAEADLVDLVEGRTDAALLYLAGRLSLLGDPGALLDIGSRIHLSHGRPLVDPAALDPEAVSGAIADVPVAHLDAVMAGPFRELVLAEVFRRLPSFLRPDRADRVRLGIGFEIGGRADGEVDRYVVRVSEGRCEVLAGAGEMPTDATLILTGAQFLRLVLGHLNPVRAVLSREVTVRGELFKALAFNSVMRIPGI